MLGQGGEAVQRRGADAVGGVDDRLAAQPGAEGRGSLGHGGAVDREQHDVSVVDRGADIGDLSADPGGERGQLGVAWVAGAEGDDVSGLSKSGGQRASDDARADDGDLRRHGSFSPGPILWSRTSVNWYRTIALADDTTPGQAARVGWCTCRAGA